MERFKIILRPIYAPFLRGFRQRADLRAEQRRITRAVIQSRQSGGLAKVILGAGNRHQEGWIATDIPAFDVLSRRHWQLLFPPHSIHRMNAEHVFEHLTTEQFGDFLANARLYLAPTGRIRIAVPDGNHADPAYIDSVRPGGAGVGADDHKVLYTCGLVSELLEKGGYQFELLEYFDEAGMFHRRPWSAEDGFVSRSAEHDRRNADGALNYTSLIFDCWL